MKHEQVRKLFPASADSSSGLCISYADDALLALVELQKFCLGDSGVPHLIDDVRLRLGHRA